MKRLTCSLALLFSFGLASSVSAQPARGMTVHDATDAFTVVTMLCLTALERGVKLADLDDWKKIGFQPATAEQRAKDTRIKDASTPMWAPPAGPLLVSEPETGCEIAASQLPVDVAFNQTVGIIRGKWPDFSETPEIKANGRTLRQITRAANGVRYTIFLRGSEPNAPGMNSKVSVLFASVTREKDDPRRAAVLAALNNHPIKAYLRVSPIIPPDDLQNILKKSEGLTADRNVLGVLDTSMARNGGVGLYFFADGMVSVKPVTGSSYIPYDAIRGVKPEKRPFAIRYGEAELQAGGARDELITIVDAILATTTPK